MRDVRKAIREVRNENRKKYTFLILVILIVGGTLWLRGPVDTQVVTYTNPNRLSYDLPELSQPNLIFTQQKFVSGTCENNNNTILCTEPIAMSFFVQYYNNVNRYEYRVHMRLKNNGGDIFDVRPVIAFHNTGCGFTGRTFNLSAGQTTGRLDFTCPATSPLNEQEASLTIKYNDDGYKQAKITIKFQ